MVLIEKGLGYVGGEIGFLLFRGSISDAQITISRKPRLLSHMVMAMT